MNQPPLEGVKPRTQPGDTPIEVDEEADEVIIEVEPPTDEMLKRLDAIDERLAEAGCQDKKVSFKLEGCEDAK